MAAPKAGLLAGDRYQRFVAAWRVAEMVVASAFERDGVRAVRVEVSDAGKVDDVAEQTADGRHLWQVKRGAGELDAADVEAIVRGAVADHTHLVLRQVVTVSSLGEIGVLGDLLDRVRRPDVDPALVRGAAPKTQIRWLKAVVRWLGSDAAALAALQRVHVHIVGDEAQIERIAGDGLRTVFSASDAHTAWNAILAWVERTTSGDQRLTAEASWGVLRGLALLPEVPRQRSAERRRLWLEGMAAALGATRPLDGVPFGGLAALRMVDLWVPRVVEVEESRTVEQMEGSNKPDAIGGGSELRTVRSGLTDALWNQSRCVVRLVGAAGLGKTETLRRTCLDLAQRALTDPAAPVPVFLHAADLADGVDVAINRSVSAGVPERLPMIILVDGFDEVPASGRRAVLDKIRVLAAAVTTRVIVVATRPNAAADLVPADKEMRLAPWSSADAQALLARWERVDPARVAQWRVSPHLAAVGGSPLTLTLALRAPASTAGGRFALFEGLVADLFLEWSHSRSREGVEVAERWDEVRPVLAEIALNALAGGGTVVTRVAIEQAFRRRNPSKASQLLDWSARMFGVLVRVGGDRYDFVLRPVAEHLAGLRLAEQPTDEIVAVELARLNEVVRHAVGCLAAQDRANEVRAIVDALLATAASDVKDVMLYRPRGLRQLLAAIAIAADCDAAVTPISVDLARVISKYLTEETSIWVGERVADALTELAGSGGAVWSVLRADLIGFLAPRRCDAADWYRDLGTGTTDDWMLRCFHRDPHVRAVAVGHLVALAEEPTGQVVLLNLVCDSPESAFLSPPAALVAARALRSAPRGDNFEPARQHLQKMLQGGPQTVRGGAAIALRPGEAPPQDIARALMILASGFGGFQDVIDDLAASQDGCDALDAIWPEWRNGLRNATGFPRPAGVGDTPPASRVVTERVARVFSGARELLLSEREALRQAAVMGNPAAQRTLFARPREHRDQVFSILQGCLPGDYQDAERLRTHGVFRAPPVDAQESLGASLLADEQLRQATLSLWSRTTPETRGQFPGHAAEFAVRNGDAEFEAIYAAWVATDTSIFVEGHRRHIPEDLLGRGAVRESVTAAVSRIMDWVEIPAADGTRGSPETAAGSLRRWWPAWDEKGAVLRVAGWLADPSRRNAALEALSAGIPTCVDEEDLARQLADAVRLSLPKDTVALVRLMGPIADLAAGPWGERLGAEWIRLAEDRYDDVARIGEMAVCQAFDGPEVQAVAADLAQEWPAVAPGWHEPRTFLPAIRRAPQHFAERCRALVADRHFDALELVQMVTPHLDPDDARELLLAVVDSRYFVHPLPWRQRVNARFSYARPLDLLDKIRFELGIPIVDVARADAADESS